MIKGEAEGQGRAPAGRMQGEAERWPEEAQSEPSYTGQVRAGRRRRVVEAAAAARRRCRGAGGAGQARSPMAQ